MGDEEEPCTPNLNPNDKKVKKRQLIVNNLSPSFSQKVIKSGCDNYDKNVFTAEDSNIQTVTNDLVDEELKREQDELGS